MAERPGVVVDLAEKLRAELRTARMPEERIGKTERYLGNDHDLPVAPGKDKNAHRAIARKSIDNWLPLVTSTYAQSLFVDGYRPKRSSDNASVWSTWQANGMDARQSIVTRSALNYGVGYGLTLRSTGSTPVMKALSALRTTAWYEDEDDEWPVIGLYAKGKTRDDRPLFQAYDDEFVYTLVEGDAGKLTVAGLDPHGLKVCPLTRFRTQLDEESVGVVYPLIPAQDRINETVFALMMALRYASFRQRWASGLTIEFDDDENPIAPFKAGIDQLWITDNHEARMGDFAQTETRGHLEAYTATIRTLAARGQISPNILTGDMINLSADALAQLRDSTERQCGEFRTIMGESWEQWFRLSAYAAGDRTAALDTESEVRWRSSEPESFSSKIEALGNMVTLLGVPADAVWELVPGVTDGDITRWKAAAGRADGMAMLAQVLQGQSEPATPAVSAPEPEVG